MKGVSLFVEVEVQLEAQFVEPEMMLVEAETQFAEDEA